MMRFTPSRFLIALLACCAGSLHAAEPDSAGLLSTIESIGRINGRALACGHADVVGRAKHLVIERVSKTRPLGEAYENATQKAFLAQGLENTPCPSREALTVELEIAAHALAKPGIHKNADDNAAPQPGINPRYLLQASNGTAVMDGDFPDQFQLISFGYTFCPDVCPTTLAEMAAILKQLDEQASHIVPLFISVDPERDTLAQLKAYTNFFDARIIGVTGSPDLVKRAADNFKVRYEKVIEPGADPANYAVDHSAGMFLLAPGGQFLTKFTYGTPVTDIVARLKEEIKIRFAPKDSAGQKP